MNSTIVKIFQYPLLATTFTRKECDRLIQLIHNVVLAKLGICKKFLKDLRFGSKELLGLGWDDIYVNQGVDKLGFYLEERNSNSLSDSLVRALFEWAIVYIGIGGYKLFRLEYYKYESLLPKIWVKSLWQFVQENHIRIPKIGIDLELQRIGDQFLMLAFQNNSFKNKALMKLNRCCLFFQVTTLLDIIDSSGDQICALAYNGV